MTTLKKNGLTVALVAAMGFAGSASAFTITTTPAGAGGAPATENVALFDVTSATDTYTVVEDVNLNIVASDLIVGRDAAFAIRIDLSNGAKFASAPTLTLGTSAPAASWATSVVGGGSGFSYIIIRVNPTVSPLPATDVVTPGTVLTIAGGYTLDHLTALTVDGATVTLTAQFQDPLSSTVILSPKSFTLLKSGDPTEFTCDPTSGDVSSRIDVGTGDPAGSYESKTTFSYYGNINGGGYYYFDAGALDFNVASGFPAFSYQATDEFTTVLTGSSFSSFADGAVTLYLCSGPIAGDVSADGTTVTFEYTGADLCAPTTSASGEVVFGTDGSEIDPTTISASTTISRNNVTSTSTDCGLLPLQYNGSVVKVATFNPGGNTTQQSFLRVTNPSILSGNVTITGIDDAGNPGESAVVVSLPAGKSIQLNSDLLENGGAGVTGKLGDGTGKWRLVVTGEFDKMRVASLNRNTVSGTVTNLTDYDTNAEQSHLIDTSGLPGYINAILPAIGSDY